jgi:cell division GTPase FtsZ
MNQQTTGLKQQQTLLVGFGGAGCELAAACARELGLNALYLNTDRRHIARWPRNRRLLLAASAQPGYASLSPKRIMAAVRACEGTFVEQLERHSRVVLFAGLGGTTGTHALVPLADAVGRCSRISLLAITTPFDFESERASVAAAALADLRTADFDVRVYDHAAGQKSRPNASMQDLLDAAAKSLTRDIRLWHAQAATTYDNKIQ